MARLVRFASAPPASVGDHTWRDAEPPPTRSKRRLRSMLHSVGVLEDAALELKGKLRRGIGHADRAGVWMELITRFGPVEDRLAHTARYHAALNDAFGGELDGGDGVGAFVLPLPPPLRWVPTFGGEVPGPAFAKEHGLSAAKLAVVYRVLCTLSYATCREDCPPLPDVVAMLAHELPEPFVHSAALQLLSTGELLEWDPDADEAPRVKSAVLAQPKPTPRAAFERSVLEAFAELAALRCRGCVFHLASLGLSVEQLCAPWLRRFFVGTLPYPTAVRVFDSFLLEGAKVLFRVGIALLKRHKAALLACSTAEEARATIAARLHSEHDACELMGAAFGLRSFKLQTIHTLQRKTLQRARACTGPELLLHPAPEGVQLPPPAPHTPTASGPAAFFVPRLVDVQRELLATLDLEVRRQLWAALPPAERARDGVLVYCNRTHGSSLRTLYARCEAAGADTRGALVVARALDGRGVFGGYSSHGVRPSAAQAYGSGESFLFTAAASDSCAGAAVITYGWSRANDLFAHGDGGYWAMGGGRAGGFGLWVDGEVAKGASSPCETFALEVSLHEGGAEHFAYSVLEVWALQ